MSEAFQGRKLEDLKSITTSASCSLITQYNPLLLNIKTIIKKHLPVLHSSEMLQIFPENTVNVRYRRNKNLKELISLSLFPRPIKENNRSIEKCNRRCYICKNFLVFSAGFTCHATKHKYKVFFNLFIFFKYYLFDSMQVL